MDPLGGLIYPRCIHVCDFTSVSRGTNLINSSVISLTCILVSLYVNKYTRFYWTKVQSERVGTRSHLSRSCRRCTQGEPSSTFCTARSWDSIRSRYEENGTRADFGADSRHLIGENRGGRRQGFAFARKAIRERTREIGNESKA